MTDVSIPSPVRARTSALHHPAIIVALSALILFVNNGFILIGLTAFDPQILARFDAGVGAVKLRDAFTFGTVAVAGPLAGYLIDRIGLRPLMIGGMILMALGMAAYPYAENLYTLYGIHVLFGLCLVTSGLFANVILVASSVYKHRGLALGLIIAGSSLGQAVAPGINNLLASGWGWQNTLLANAALPLLVIPFILTFMPSIKAHETGQAGHIRTGPTYGEALRHRNFWLLAFIAMVGFCVELGVVTNMVLYAQRDLGLGVTTASGAVFAIFGTAIVTQIAGGWLADRFSPKFVHMASLGIMTVGCFMLTLQDPIWMWAGGIVFGLGWGGNYALIQLLTSNIFLGPSVGKILGTIAVIESIGAAAGPPVIGGLYDYFGNFQMPFSIAAVALATTIIAVRMLDLRHESGPN